MKERPVIFNGEMVRTILYGRKTQTRRVIANVGADNCIPLQKQTKTKDGIYTHVMDAPMYGLCPFGQVGDRLWVRETWGVVSHDFDSDGWMIDWVPDRPATPIEEMSFGNGYYTGHAIYAADGSFTWGDDDGHGERSCWKPSIHMPRAACRILLEIIAVRVERLNDISENDAKAEGAPTELCLIGEKHFLGFRTLWKSIYGEENWSANPWVWVIEFRRVGGSDASK
ncbi:ASCH domain-containing protein [Serratia proteamaculans]|uniref:hypothetical protein n=1 Tax=Serratia proteamaculans TaxID=28151 RepID=UPI002178A138|nr:hypothetical protein [Serratia proteamaculans]CAI1761359.1 Uncharacterised protein [Serratia proteamaculans]